MRRTKEDALITKECLMDTSLEIFNLKGYSHTTLDDIASGAQLTRGAFYFHFKDKEDLFKQLLARELDFISLLIVDSFVSEGDEKQQLQSLLSNLVDNFYDNKRFRNIIQLTWFRTEVTEGCTSLIDKTNLNEFFIEEVEKLIKSAQKNKLINKSLDPLTIAIQFAIQINGMYRLYFVTPKYLKRKSHLHAIMLQNIDFLFR
jgi:TetR/AcrR family acrAB operon transcriptional repressor